MMKKRLLSILAALALLLGTGTAVSEHGSSAEASPMYSGTSMFEGWNWGYLGGPCGTAGPIAWSSMTNYSLEFQTDGNLVAYRNYDGRAIWASNTYAPGGRLCFQSNGNVMIYNTAGRVMWQTGTTGGGYYLQFVMQDDGNVVMYDTYGPRWASRGGLIRR